MKGQTILLVAFAALAACGFSDAPSDNSEASKATVPEKTEAVSPTPATTTIPQPVPKDESSVAAESQIQPATGNKTAKPSGDNAAATIPAKSDGKEQVQGKITTKPASSGDSPSSADQSPKPVLTSTTTTVETKPAPGASLENSGAPVLDASGSPSHAPFSALLKQYVNAKGGVNYQGLKSNHQKLKNYLQILADNPPADAWSRDEKLAYWINAYNAATLDLILNNYPLKSITDLDGGKPWDVKRIKLGNKTYSLNEIENEIIRPQFNEPRIHFAVNCAAASCPPLRNEAFVASKLNAQLEEQTKQFLNNPQYTKVESDKLVLSRIFDWYGKDFGDIPAFVKKYRSVPSGVTVMFSDYDWTLNKQQ